MTDSSEQDYCGWPVGDCDLTADRDALRAENERLRELLDRAVNGVWRDGDLESARAALDTKGQTHD